MMKKTKWIWTLIILIVVSPAFGGQNRNNHSPWNLLKNLVLIPGVSGSEQNVADFIQSLLPAQLRIQRDHIHNLWFTEGEGRPHLLFVAHTDEIGFVVQEITPVGTLKVERKGGFFLQMYEGRSVVIYTNEGSVEGIVMPRSDYYKNDQELKTYDLENIEIYLGVSSEEEAKRLGVQVGDQVTINKKIIDLTPDIIATRAVDDRAGCAALLAASHKIDWNKIKNKTITFVWDVQEETGLIGASSIAESLKPDSVFAVDTFVSSDSPLESRRFAYTLLGKGVVVRAIDSSNIAPQSEFKKVLDIARTHSIPVQLGYTRGGNDGSVFVPEGAVDIPLSWPGTYSHSFIEKIHRQDLEALTDLIIAIVKDW